MSERVIIKSELSNVVKKLCRLIILAGLFVGILAYVVMHEPSYNGYDTLITDLPTLPLAMVMFGGAEAAVVAALIWYIYGKSELTVTDKRVYGKAIFGKRVDIPFDSISAVGTSSLLKGVAVSSSSGRLVFTAIANNDEVHRVISDLLLERQSKGTAVIKQEISQSNADELKKYKELLDSGIITQQEFENKKKQLLNL